MVYLYGGAYFAGSGNDNRYGPDFLLENHVIVITLNYRLGIFGFLNMNTPEHSGNMGLKDQQLALQWIYENIEQFHGDNKRITAFGQSAGGSSAHFHILSSNSRKYIRNVISMSGVADDYWAINNKDDHWKLAYEIANDFNETQISPNDLIQLLTSVSPQSIVYYGNSPSFVSRICNAKFAPVVESWLNDFYFYFYLYGFYYTKLYSSR